MLPYNAGVPPFLQNGWTCAAFGACDAVRLEEEKYREARASGRQLRGATPAGVSLCVEPQALGLERPTPDDILEWHYPIEHLLHDDCPAGGGGGDALPSPKDGPPAWVEGLAHGNPGHDGEQFAATSAIISHPDGDPRCTPSYICCESWAGGREHRRAPVSGLTCLVSVASAGWWQGDKFFDEDPPAVRELADSTAAAELFVYPGDKHLFADGALDAYDPEASELLMEGVRAFLSAA